MEAGTFCHTGTPFRTAIPADVTAALPVARTVVA